MNLFESEAFVFFRTELAKNVYGNDDSLKVAEECMRYGDCLNFAYRFNSFLRSHGIGSEQESIIRFKWDEEERYYDEELIHSFVTVNGESFDFDGKFDVTRQMDTWDVTDWHVLRFVHGKRGDESVNEWRRVENVCEEEKEHYGFLLEEEIPDWIHPENIENCTFFEKTQDRGYEESFKATVEKFGPPNGW